MRELLVDTCRTEDEAGANHTFAYYILVDQMELGDGFACESYGVKVVGEEGETALAFAPALEGNPETAVNKKEFWAEINEGLDMLPEKQRQAIILREITGLSYYEIAQISGCTEGTVKSRIARGREKLADFLIKRGTFAPGKRHNSAKGGEAK